MKLSIGQKVAYPGQGVCVVESQCDRSISGSIVSGSYLKVLSDGSTIFIPDSNTDTLGLRPLISAAQCKRLISRLAEAFESASTDWKARSRELVQNLKSGDVFAAADVLKKLTFLANEKRLSFREQTLLEKAKFLIVSEITNVASRDQQATESDVLKRVEQACIKHKATNP